MMVVVAGERSRKGVILSEIMRMYPDDATAVRRSSGSAGRAVEPARTAVRSP